MPSRCSPRKARSSSAMRRCARCTSPSCPRRIRHASWCRARWRPVIPPVRSRLPPRGRLRPTPSAELNLNALHAATEPDPDSERLLMCHAIEDTAAPLPRGDARGAERRLPEPGALDAELFAEGRGDRAAARRRRARGEESAECDDHPSRAAQAEGRIDQGTDRRAGAGRRPVATARPGEAREHHRGGDQAPRRSRRRVPQVRAARGIEAPAGAVVDRHPRRRADDHAGSAAAAGHAAGRVSGATCRPSTPIRAC